MCSAFIVSSCVSETEQFAPHQVWGVEQISFVVSDQCVHSLTGIRKQTRCIFNISWITHYVFLLTVI